MSEAETKTDGRGGWRPGSGRKPKPPSEHKVAFSRKLDPEVVAFLRAQENGAATIERLVKSSQIFQVWKSRQPT